MKINPLFKIVEANDINIVTVSPSELQSHVFDVGSTEYDTKHDWLVKGEFDIRTEPSGVKILYCERLEETVDITLNRPEIVLGEKIDDAMSIPVHAIVFNRTTLSMAGKEVQKKHVTAFAHACVKNYNDSIHTELPIEDFAVIEIDFSNKHVELKSIAPLEQ